MANAALKRLKVDPPSEIVFTGPFNRVVASSLLLTNTTTEKLCFKIKTTAPKCYCVKPSFGFVEPLQSTNVEMDNVAEKNKHKFMIQSMVAPSVEKDLDAIWKGAEPSEIQDCKLKCIMKFDDIVQINPTTDLEFKNSEAIVTIKNTSAANICYKVSSTAPEKINVKPGHGILIPEQELSVLCKFLLLFISGTYMGTPQAEIVKDKLQFSVLQIPDISEYSDTLWKNSLNKKIEFIFKCNYKASGDQKVMCNNLNHQASKLANYNTTETVTGRHGLLADKDAYRERLNLFNMQSSQNWLGMMSVITYLIISFILGVLCGKYVL